MDTDDFVPIPDGANKPNPGPTPNPGPAVPDIPLDPADDISKGQIVFLDGKRYKHTGSAIKPRIKIILPGKHYPVYEPGYESNVIITYENNVDVGIAKIIAKGDSVNGFY